MRTTKLFATFLVAGLIASACAQDPDYVLPEIKVASEELNFSAETEQALEFTATRDWRVQSKPDWVTVVPDQGSGSGTAQRVSVSVAANPDYNRSGEVVLTIGLDKAHVAVIQPGAKGEVPVGTGTKEDPYTVTGVLRYIATLGADVESENDVYVTGTISAVTEAYSAQYGNATFEMTSDSGEKFTFYRGLYLGNKKWTANDTQIKVGDAVVVCGKVINFKGNTPETQQNKAYLYSLNGETQGTGGGGSGSTGTPSGTGTQADPYNVAAARAAVANLTWTSTTDYQKTDPVYVKGKISKIADNGTYGASGTFGNATFFISDDGSTSNELEAYRILYLGNQKYTSGTDIKVGDEVIIYASLMNYRGNTPETVQSGAYLYSLNGVTEGGSGSGGNNQGGGNETPSSEIKTVTIAEFLTAPDSDKQKYQLTGKIANIATDKNDSSKPNAYGNFDLVDGENSVYVYGLTKTEQGLKYDDNGKFTGSANNDRSFASLNLKEGDTLTLIGYHYTYKGQNGDKVEVLGAYYVSHTPAN